ncbi:MAG: acylphosphatase [Candidatus Geothermincolales bacterium]
MAKRAHVFVSGKVQGVYYRSYAEDAARRLGVRGWIRNLSDGRVEAVFEGEDEAVEEMIRWCWQGSPMSRVDKVEVEWEPYRGEFQDFSVRYWR